MSTNTLRIQKSATHPHIEWIEIYGDGILHECAVLHIDQLGNRLFFQVNHLDTIDRNRLAHIMSDRNARTLPLYEIMRQKTLGNGINALQYFHQYVKILTPNGKVLDTKSGQVGVGARAGEVNLNEKADKPAKKTKQAGEEKADDEQK